MNAKVVLFLSVGTLLMTVPMLIIQKRYQQALWKVLPIALASLVAGTLSAYLFFWLENGEFGGRSFYGVVLLIPVLYFPFAKILRMPYGELMDLCAPAECVILVMMKVLCQLEGCCGGRVVAFTSDGIPVRFPSRMAELAVAVIIFGVLMLLAWHKKQRGCLYAWYMLFYGSTRFVLNIFREEWLTTELLMPLGNMWSVCAVAIALIVLLRNRKQTVKNKIAKQC